MLLSDTTIKEVLDRVEAGMKEIDFGEIIIDLRETSDVIDIVVKRRERIKKLN